MNRNLFRSLAVALTVFSVIGLALGFPIYAAWCAIAAAACALIGGSK